MVRYRQLSCKKCGYAVSSFQQPEFEEARKAMQCPRCWAEGLDEKLFHTQKVWAFLRAWPKTKR